LRFSLLTNDIYTLKSRDHMKTNVLQSLFKAKSNLEEIELFLNTNVHYKTAIKSIKRLIRMCTPTKIDHELDGQLKERLEQEP
jgi:hypothetical protein